MEKMGQKIIIYVIDWLIEHQKNGYCTKYDEINKLILPFIEKDKSEDLDLLTICKLELLLEEKLIWVPTKQQWRKIKLKKLNDLNK